MPVKAAVRTKKTKAWTNGDEKFVKVKRHQRQEGEIRRHLVHRIEEVFAAEDVAVEAEGEGDRADEKDGQHLDPADEEEDKNEEPVGEDILEPDLRSKDVKERSADA